MRFNMWPYFSPTNLNFNTHALAVGSNAVQFLTIINAFYLRIFGLSTLQGTYCGLYLSIAGTSFADLVLAPLSNTILRVFFD
jgi:hypothetical protein